MLRLEISCRCGEMREIRRDGRVGNRLGGRRPLGVAGGLIQGGAGQIVADLAKIPRGVAVGKPGLAQEADDSVDAGDASIRWPQR
jgi:hypothetical protein